MNIVLIKKIITEKKTTFPSLKNQDWKKGKSRNRKDKRKLLIDIPTDNITELNELIGSGAKLICDKIDAPLENPNKSKCG